MYSFYIVQKIVTWLTQDILHEEEKIPYICSCAPQWRFWMLPEVGMGYGLCRLRNGWTLLTSSGFNTFWNVNVFEWSENIGTCRRGCLVPSSKSSQNGCNRLCLDAPGFTLDFFGNGKRRKRNILALTLDEEIRSPLSIPRHCENLDQLNIYFQA